MNYDIRFGAFCLVYYVGIVVTDASSGQNVSSKLLLSAI